MIPDYFAHLAQKEYPNGFEEINNQDIDEVTTCYHVQVATGHKDDKDAGGNDLRSKWAANRLNVQMRPLPASLQPPAVDLGQLSFGSFYIQFEFKLLKPYISRDDTDFYIVDNPIVRDKVFRYPMVRPSAWKGSLSHALWQLGYEEDDEREKGQQVRRLFGTANDEKPDEGKRGRLYFYPSFFTKISLEVINPHDRERRVGKNPILMECVPIASKGCFTLLYTPLDLIGENEGENEKETRQQTAQDLQLVVEGLRAMLTLYGFGAKTSSGFGIADIVGEGCISINCPEEVDRPAKPVQPAEPEVVRAFREKFADEDFQLKPDEWHKKQGASKKKRSEYKQAREAYRKYVAERQQYQEQLQRWEISEQKPISPVTVKEFRSWDELQNKATEMAELLKGGGE